MVAVGADVADGEGGVGGDLLFYVEGPTEDGWGGDVGLDVRGRDERAGWLQRHPVPQNISPPPHDDGLPFQNAARHFDGVG